MSASKFRGAIELPACLRSRGIPTITVTVREVVSNSYNFDKTTFFCEIKQIFQSLTSLFTHVICASLSLISRSLSQGRHQGVAGCRGRDTLWFWGAQDQKSIISFTLKN